MADMTYLAVELSCIIRIDQAKYYGHESGHTRGRAHLQKDAEPDDKMCAGADHYCPAVRSMPSNDTPLEVKSGDELPAT